MKIRGVYLKRRPNALFTSGLKKIIGKEIGIENPTRPTSEYAVIFKYLIDFILEEKPTFNHGDKVGCYCWSLRLRETQNFFQLYEFYPEKEGFIPGVEITLQLYSEQSGICSQLKTQPQFPLFDQYVQVAPGVISGNPLHLFRWAKPDPYSGWIVVDTNFDWNMESTEFYTIGQFITMRPDARKFLALPPGYEVHYSGNDVTVGFKPEMAKPE